MNQGIMIKICLIYAYIGVCLKLYMNFIYVSKQKKKKLQINPAYRSMENEMKCLNLCMLLVVKAV